MSIFSTIIEMIVKRVWPWIIENVWPLIQTQVIAIFVELMGWLVQQIKDMFKTKGEERAKQAEEKAQSAEKKAESSPDEKEADVYRAEAAIWREVEKQYRQDIEDMKKRITELEAETMKDVKNDVETLNPTLNFDSNLPSFSIGEFTHRLPEIK